MHGIVRYGMRFFTRLFRLLPEDTPGARSGANQHNCNRASLPGRTRAAHSPEQDDGSGWRCPRLTDNVAGPPICEKMVSPPPPFSCSLLTLASSFQK